MCTVSQDVLDKLNTTVEQFVSEGRMFTGYDVTLETRERENIKLRHSEVRGDIHDLPALKDEFEFGDYERHEINMPGGGWAWVYHKKGDDPNQYTPRNQQQSPAQRQQTSTPVAASTVANASPNVATLNAPSSDGTVSDSGGRQDDGSYATDYRDRLMVPKTYLEAASLRPGDECYVHHDIASSKIVLADGQQSNLMLLGTYRVERNGDLRLSAKTLRNLGTADKFQIENESGKVAIQTA